VIGKIKSSNAADVPMHKQNEQKIEQQNNYYLPSKRNANITI